jgi:signal peptidase II
MSGSRTFRLAAVFLVLAFTAGCDQATKHLARTELSQVGSTFLPGGFIELSLAENPGAFLSLGASLPETARGILSAGVAVGLAALLLYLLRAKGLHWFSFLGFVLIWAGGMSNSIDRFARHGLVTDFIIMRIGPLHTGVFNLADLSIVAGTLMLVLSLRTRRKPAQSAG